MTGAGRPGPSRLTTHTAIVVTSFSCFILSRLVDGAAGQGFGLIGVGACGWAWLLTRALFDGAPHDSFWPKMLATIVHLTGAVGMLAPNGAVAVVADNAYALTGSAALVLTFIEPLHGLRGELTPAERGFRAAFLAVYGALIAAAILAPTPVGGPQTLATGDVIKAVCGAVGLFGALAAVHFRRGHALPSPDAARAVRRAPTDEDERIAGRLLELLRNEQLELDPDLRIAAVARRLQEPEHKVSQCISSALGFANFNRLINHHRIERAKRLLADPDMARPILDIAFDCGFASLGPFNRAFKDEVGETPRAFRARARGAGLEAR